MPTCCFMLCALGLASLPGSLDGPGRIRITVDTPQRVTAVSAIHRKTGVRYPGEVDRTSGTLTIEGLPAGASYDCLIDCGAARLEGIDLSVPRSDYVEEQPLTALDRETIERKVRRLNKFEDVVEILAMQGNIQHAAILLNKLRTRPFFGSKPGEVVWRVELWHFERPEETWVKVQDELFIVLYRERLQHAAYKKKAITFDPRLGGVQLPPEKPVADLGRVALPQDKPGVVWRFPDAKQAVAAP